MKTALITGYTGQDGTFLTELLLEKGYKVVGLVRRISTEPPRRVRGRFDFSQALKERQLELAEGDLLSRASLDRIINQYEPDEIYNLAAQSHVGLSFGQPEFTIEANLMGLVNLAESLRAHGQNWKLYQASTSEMFGDGHSPDGPALNEQTAFNPNSPYAIAKVAAHCYMRMLRQQGHFATAGILFNHESEIRGGDFVTQKIARAVAAYISDPSTTLSLGNLDAQRDWGYAGDYVKAMWAMMQYPDAGEWVIGTGTPRTVRQFVEAAVKTLGLDGIEWRGEGANETGRLIYEGKANEEPFVFVDPAFYRPVDVNFLRADSTKAAKYLGWQPQTSFEQMVELMVNNARGE